MFTHVFTSKKENMSREEASKIVKNFEDSSNRHREQVISRLKQKGELLTYSLNYEIKSRSYPLGSPLPFKDICDAVLKYYNVEEIFQDVIKSIDNLDSCKPFKNPDMLKSKGLKLEKVYDYQLYVLDQICERIDTFVGYILAEASSRRIDLDDKELGASLKLMYDKRLEAVKLKRKIIEAIIYKFPKKPLTTVPLEESGLNLFESVTPS